MSGTYASNKYALLCGSAPADFWQKKLVDMHDFLTSEAGGFVPERNIGVFPSGVSELMLESVLNGVLDEAADENESDVCLYFCALSSADLCAELSGSACGGIEVVRLGGDEIRKEIIAYYADLAENLGVTFQVMYEADGEVVSEKALGYEKIGARVC